MIRKRITTNKVKEMKNKEENQCENQVQIIEEMETNSHDDIRIVVEIRNTETEKTPEVQGFPFTETDEIEHHFQNETFDLENINFNMENYQSFMRHLLYSDQSDTFASTSSETSTSEVPVNNMVVQKLEVEIFKKLQETQEERIILEVGNQQFHTSRVTMRADPNSLLAMLFRKGCPFRPSTSYGRPTYYFDRDSSHFRFILNYLRNGAMVKEGSLPRERRYLLEMLCEARFFRLRGLEDAILARLEHSTD